MDDIQIIQLPPERWKEYKELRLEALKNDPQAFGQKYVRAADFPDSYWIDHLKNTMSKNSLLVYFAENNGNLIGMMGAFFPVSKTEKDYARVFSVYVNKDFRGQGISKKLQDYLLSKLRKIKGLKKVIVMVNKQQQKAVNLYLKGGFKVIKTQKELLGDGKEYEVDTLEQDLH